MIAATVMKNNLIRLNVALLWLALTAGPETLVGAGSRAERSSASQLIQLVRSMAVTYDYVRPSVFHCRRWADGTGPFGSSGAAGVTAASWQACGLSSEPREQRGPQQPLTAPEPQGDDPKTKHAGILSVRPSSSEDWACGAAVPAAGKARKNQGGCEKCCAIERGLLRALVVPIW